MNDTVARMLGEAVPAADVVDPQAAAPAAAPEEPAQVVLTTNPTVQQLVSMWQGGQHEAVALRVLDALDMYADFLELAFQIGHEEAIQLGQIMDTMTSEEHSPHEYDQMADQDIPSKLGKRPIAGDAHNAAGE